MVNHDPQAEALRKAARRKNYIMGFGLIAIMTIGSLLTNPDQQVIGAGDKIFFEQIRALKGYDEVWYQAAQEVTAGRISENEFNL